MFRQLTAICIVGLVLLIFYRAVSTPQFADIGLNLSMVPDQQTAEKLWADACWHALLSHDDDEFESNYKEMSKFFVDAIEHAEQKAPIYVSYGVNDSGPFQLKAVFDELIVSAMLEHDTIAAISDDEGKPSYRKRFDMLVEQSLSKYATSNTFEGHLNELQNLIQSGTDLSRICYQAAVAENPDYLPAWYFLAHACQGNEKESILRKWIEREPQNALPRFLLANEIWKPQYHTNKQTLEKTFAGFGEGFPEAFSLIQEGVQCEYFQIHSEEWPRQAPSYSWEDAPKLSDAILDMHPKVEIASKPVTIAGVKNLSFLFNDRFSFDDPDKRALWQLGANLRDAARFSRQNQDFKRAELFLYQSFLMGEKIFKTKRFVGMGKYHGYVIMNYACFELKEFDRENQGRIDPMTFFELRVAIERFKIFTKMQEGILKQALPDLIEGKIDWLQHLESLDKHFLHFPPRYFVDIPTEYGCPPARPK